MHPDNKSQELNFFPSVFCGSSPNLEKLKQDESWGPLWELLGVHAAVYISFLCKLFVT